MERINTMERRGTMERKDTVERKDTMERRDRTEFCDACGIKTEDWMEHRNTKEHCKNDKKVHCLCCNKRMWPKELRWHIKKAHQDCGFTCNITHQCCLRFLELDSLIEHIHCYHKDQIEAWGRVLGHSSLITLRKLIQEEGLLFPVDLRRLSCRLCGLKFLAQGQAALYRHFNLQHPGLPLVRYSPSILFECRTCEGDIFSSENSLVKHFQERHCYPGLSCKRQVGEQRWSRKGDQPPWLHWNKHSRHDIYRETSPSVGELDPMEICPFCDHKFLCSGLGRHMMDTHEKHMFACDPPCTFASPWRSELLAHLSCHHSLGLGSGSQLSGLALRLPHSLAMVSCRVETCLGTVFLGRNMEQVLPALESHWREMHCNREGGMEESYSLSCRCCAKVFSMAEGTAWQGHLDNCSEGAEVGGLVPTAIEHNNNSSGNLKQTEENVDVDLSGMLECRFCSRFIAGDSLIDHEMAKHSGSLFQCPDCDEEPYSCAEAADLAEHMGATHSKRLELQEVPGPRSGDTTLAVCSLCQAQLCTGDPMVLALHLQHHNCEGGKGTFAKYCRICSSITGSKVVIIHQEKHNRTTHPLLGTGQVTVQRQHEDPLSLSLDIEANVEELIEV